MYHNYKPFSVWIVEDDLTTLEMVRDVVDETEEFRCEYTFINCDAFLKTLKCEQQPDVVFLALRFSTGMKGIEAIDQIHTIAPITSIVVISGYYDEKTVLSVLKRGVAGYLCKPLDPEHITNALKDILQGIAHFSSPIVENIQTALSKVKSGVPDYGFTRQEKRLLPYIAEGLHEKEMAERLCISVNTVHNHIKNIYRKSNVHSKPEAVNKIISQGLLSSQDR